MTDLTSLDVLLRREERDARHRVESLSEDIEELEMRLNSTKRSLGNAMQLQQELVEALVSRNVTPTPA